MMRILIVAACPFALLACEADSDTCNTHAFGDVAESEMPTGLAEQAAALADAVGTWGATVDDKAVTLMLSTDVDSVEVNLGEGLCGGGGGPATSSVEVQDGTAVTDSSGECNLVTLESDPAWCEFEAELGSWQIDIDDDGAMSASFGAVLVGGSADDAGVVVTDWVREE